MSRITKKDINWDKAHRHLWIKDIFSIPRKADLAYICLTDPVHLNK